MLYLLNSFDRPPVSDLFLAHREQVTLEQFVFVCFFQKAWVMRIMHRIVLKHAVKLYTLCKVESSFNNLARGMREAKINILCVRAS